MGDRTLGAIGLVLSLFYIWQATQIQLSFISDPVGPRTFPIIICVLMAIASVVMIVMPDPTPHWPPLRGMIEIGLAVVVMFIYASLLPTLGFLIATALAATFLTWRLGTPPLQSVLIGVAISIGIYIVFKLILGLSLAEGLLGL